MLYTEVTDASLDAAILALSDAKIWTRVLLDPPRLREGRER